MELSSQKACVIFNKLVVNQIEDASGIFIGTNQAVCWSSYSKSNYGFGSLGNSSLSNSIQILHDEDVVDASVDDTRYITLADAGSAGHQCAVDFQSINANVVNSGSAIDLGDNKQPGWRSSKKNNYGTGKSLGSNRLKQIVNLVLDNDKVDAPVNIRENIYDHVENNGKQVRIAQKPT